MSGSSKIDIEAREVREALLLAAARNDAAAALDGARRFAAAGLAIIVCAADFDGATSHGKDPTSGFGAPFAAKFACKCCVCGQHVHEGERAVYSRVSRKLAHSACAVVQ
jgi:hypothetical protein